MDPRAINGLLKFDLKWSFNVQADGIQGTTDVRGYLFTGGNSG